MNKEWASKKGFTVIELLVAIVVIAILVTITVISYNGIQQRSRDTERSGDITQLKIAIEKYHAENGSYPAVCGDNQSCYMGDLAPIIKPYLATVPHDPRYTADSSTDYLYVRGPILEDSYGLRVAYEAKSPCKTGQNINAGWWTSWAGGTPNC